MSISTNQSQLQEQHDHRPVVECGLLGCERAGRPWTFQHGHCSTEHWQRNLGRKALKDLRNAHTRCFSCMAELKDIELPKPDMEFRESGAALTYDPEDDIIHVVRYGQEYTAAAACGFQYPTTDSAIGEKNHRQKTVTGIVCGKCGSASHRAHIAFLAEGHHTAAFVVRYLAAECEDAFDTETLHREYARTDDIEFAAGAAILAERS